MKTVITVLAALAFSLSMMAQDTSKPSDRQSQSDQSSQSSQGSQTNPSSTSSQSSQTNPSGTSGQSSQTNPSGTSGQSSQTSPSSTSSSSGSNQGQRMSGKVSKDAKTFTDDTSGKSYTVSNPDSLQNYENQHVVVMLQTDPNTGNVTITAVQPPQ